MGWRDRHTKIIINKDAFTQCTEQIVETWSLIRETLTLKRRITLMKERGYMKKTANKHKHCLSLGQSSYKHCAKNEIFH